MAATTASTSKGGFAESGPGYPVVESTRVDQVTPSAKMSLTIRIILAILVACIMLIPVIWMGMTAIKSRPDATAVPPKAIFQPSLDGFIGLFTNRSQLSARALSARTYSDVAHRVFTARRDVVFREMEYAVPREAGLSALREARRAVDASDWRISFPVEVRVAPADDIPLSTASGRDTMYLAFHTHHRSDWADHTAYFAAVESIMRAHDGRPHWGKVHSRAAADLAPAYPRFEEFLTLRDRLDPDRVFANAYLRHVLGD